MAIEDRLRYAIEDRFLLLRLSEEHNLLPGSELVDQLIPVLKSFAGANQLQIVCDARSLTTITDDVAFFLSELSYVVAPHVLLRPGTELPYELRGGLPVFSRTRVPRFTDMWLEPFIDEHYDMDAETEVATAVARKLRKTTPGADDLVEYRRYLQEHDLEEDDLHSPDAMLERWSRAFQPRDGRRDLPLIRSMMGDPDGFLVRRVLLREAFRRKARHSLMVEFALRPSAGGVDIIPYHANALFEGATSKRDHIIIGRPGAIAARTGAVFSRELRELTALLRLPGVREAEIQDFLEREPSIFRALGYRTVYPQIVLERGDGTSLRPDFILEPVGSDWLEILDVKVPDLPTIVGGRDRKRFSAGLAELVAQLREYGSYFENPKWAQWAKDRYGIRGYRPKLIGLAGRDPRDLDDEQTRRLMTSYSDIKILTFDELLRVATSRLLI